MFDCDLSKLFVMFKLIREERDEGGLGGVDV